MWPSELQSRLRLGSLVLHTSAVKCLCVSLFQTLQTAGSSKDGAMEWSSLETGDFLCCSVLCLQPVESGEIIFQFSINSISSVMYCPFSLVSPCLPHKPSISDSFLFIPFSPDSAYFSLSCGLVAVLHKAQVYLVFLEPTRNPFQTSLLRTHNKFTRPLMCGPQTCRFTTL